MGFFSSTLLRCAHFHLVFIDFKIFSINWDRFGCKGLGKSDISWTIMVCQGFSCLGDGNQLRHQLGQEPKEDGGRIPDEEDLGDESLVISPI